MVIATIVQIVLYFIGLIKNSWILIMIGTGIVLFTWLYKIIECKTLGKIFYTIVAGFSTGCPIFAVCFLIAPKFFDNPELVEFLEKNGAENPFKAFLIFGIPCTVLLLLILGIILLISRKKAKEVEDTEYCRQTGTKYSEIFSEGGEAYGLQGEFDLANELDRAKNSGENLIDKIYYSIVIPSEKRPQEIDALVLSKYGIFSIEEKNRDERWMILNSSESPIFVDFQGNPMPQDEKIGNPLGQNLGHLRALEFGLEKLDKRYKTYAKGIVAFGPRTVDFTVVDNGAQIVCRNNEIVSVLAKLKEKCVQPLNDDDIAKITGYFDNCVANKELRQTHDFYVKQSMIE